MEDTIKISDKFEINNLDLFYGQFQALKSINMTMKPKMITALIGPSGCGKSTLLRCLNRMNDLIRGVRITGQVLLDGKDIYNSGTEITELRKKVGMVFQRPNPFPLSIYENVTYGLRVAGIKGKIQQDEIVEKSLMSAWLWDQLKDKLHYPALELPLDQQQRLCIARLLAVMPEVILMDEPCSALDPISTSKIEDLIRVLKKDYTIIMVTHNMQQASRVSDYTAFFYIGNLIEFANTRKIFTAPDNKQTEDYISGRFG
jgi:phosphate transport system ATP-binding protein